MELEARIDVRLEATPEAPARARQRLWELDGALAPDGAGQARLLVSELVTNALMHGPRQGQLRLRVELGADWMRVAVYDPGAGFEPARPPARPPPGATQGRGLYLLDQIAARWGTERTPEGHCVWFELPRD